MRAGGNSRCARARTRRMRRAHAALPNQNAHTIGRLDHGEFHVRALGESVVSRERGAEPMKTIRIRKFSNESHALRITHGERGHGQSDE